jgi:hypothetical protein
MLLSVAVQRCRAIAEFRDTSGQPALFRGSFFRMDARVSKVPVLPSRSGLSGISPDKQARTKIYMSSVIVTRLRRNTLASLRGREKFHTISGKRVSYINIDGTYGNI